MNISKPQPDVGYLVVKVSTARGAIPLENAAVSIRGEDENTGILYSLTTNPDGATELVSLPAPLRSSSESPGNAKPYATYSIDVFKDGYLPLTFRGVPVFSSVLSIQPAVMIPSPDGARDDRFPPTPNNAVIEEDAYGNL